MRLEGHWHVSDLDGAPTHAPAPTLDFGPDGMATGSTSVNRLRGPYRLDGGALVIGPLATTRRAGPPELMDQERRLLALLAQRCRLTADGDAVILLAGSGATARLVPAHQAPQ